MKHKWLSIKSSADGKTTTIDIDGTIGMDFWTGEGITKQNISAQLKEIGAIKGDKIIVNINSYGGDVNDGLSIHDLLVANPAEKEVRINGMTASAATVIAMCGSKIKMSENALFLVHRCWNMTIGNKNHLQAAIEAQTKVDNLMANIYSKKTGKPLDEIIAQLDVNNGDGEWLTAQEAKDKGFIHEIFAPVSMAASVDLSGIKKLGLPEIPKDKLKPNPIMKTEAKTKFDKLVAQIGTALGIVKAEKKEYETKDGKKINIEMAGEAPAIGDTVSDEAGAPTPDASYELTIGDTIKTDKDSKISEIIPATEEGAEDEAGTDADPKDENQEPATDAAVTTAITAIETELGCKAGEALAAIKKLKTENAGYKSNESHYENTLKELAKTVKSTYKPAEGNQRFGKTKTSATGVSEGIEAFKNRNKKGEVKK